jgi:hypothetical protein
MYLNDFLVVGPPALPECPVALALLGRDWAYLSPSTGPTTCLTFLGIEVDTVSGKLKRLKTLLQEWGDKKARQRRDLESLIGVLNHVRKVVRCGRTFLRRMLDLLHGVPMHPLCPHPIRLSRAFRPDRGACWGGVSFLPPTTRLLAQQLASDTSGSWGCGAYYDSHWFQLR